MANTTKSFKEMLNEYNLAVEAVRDIENSLKILIGTDTWEDDVLSSKRKSVQLLYDELKNQRNIREKFESSKYNEVTE